MAEALQYCSKYNRYMHAHRHSVSPVRRAYYQVLFLLFSLRRFFSARYINYFARDDIAAFGLFIYYEYRIAFASRYSTFHK